MTISLSLPFLILHSSYAPYLPRPTPPLTSIRSRPNARHKRPQPLMIWLDPLQLLDPTSQRPLDESDRQFRPPDGILAPLTGRKLSMPDKSGVRYAL